jgi:DNA modification methylase
MVSIGSSEVNYAIDSRLADFFESYSIDGKPIQVDFRKLVSWVPYADSYTHYIHQYPAKLLKHIPIFFLNSSTLLPEKGSIVLDPFCGSGTVLLESLLAGHASLGCDANPLARLIAKVKTNPINPIRLYPLINEVLKRAKQFRKYQTKNIINVDYWFPKHVQRDLSRIYRAIEEIEDKHCMDFFKVSFSSMIKKASYADPNLSVPVRLNPSKYREKVHREKAEKLFKSVVNLDVFDLFDRHSKANIKRMDALYRSGISTTASVIGDDARNIGVNENGKRELDNLVDLIVTSPPYAGAQKYIRASSLNLGWLGYCEENTLRFYEKKNIGREHYSVNDYKNAVSTGIDEIDDVLRRVRKVKPARAHINGNYLLEMEDSLKEMYKVLRTGGHCVLVVGNNEVCGMQFETQKYLRLLAERIGFQLCLELIDDIQSRGLMTKRNKTASIINSEWVLVFRK